MSYEGERFAGDRYERLVQGAAVLAADPLLADAPEPFDSASLSVFIEGCRSRGVLDGLSDDDADLVAMLLLLDFHLGLEHVLDCLPGVIAAERAVRQREHRPTADTARIGLAVAAALLLADEIAGTIRRREG